MPFVVVNTIQKYFRGLPTTRIATKRPKRGENVSCVWVTARDECGKKVSEMAWQQTENTWTSVACTDCGGQGSLLFHHWTGQDRRESTQGEWELEKKKKKKNDFTFGNYNADASASSSCFQSIYWSHGVYIFFVWTIIYTGDTMPLLARTQYCTLIRDVQDWSEVSAWGKVGGETWRVLDIET